MKLILREMQLDDVSAVSKLETELFPDPWPKKSFINEILAKKISFPFIVEENNEIIGYIICWYYLKELHIGNVAVTMAKQGKGVGRFLLRNIFEIFSDSDKSFLEVRETNKIAIKLYNSFGFKITYRRKSYYSNSEDALVMVKVRECNHIKDK